MQRTGGFPLAFGRRRYTLWGNGLRIPPPTAQRCGGGRFPPTGRCAHNPEAAGSSCAFASLAPLGESGQRKRLESWNTRSRELRA